MKSSDIVMKIMGMDLVQAYNWITTVENAPANVLNKARWGWLKPPIDIHDYIHGNIIPKRKKGIIMYNGNIYKTKDFWTDIEDRQKLIKSWLVNYYDDPGLASPRGLKRREEVVTVEKK